MGFPEWDMVTDQNWDFRLPQILQDISDCTFVALDFEFSGIPAHQPRASRRQSLQERYAEVKEAARTYQILQVGLTIVQEDPVAGKYTLQPYNIQLSPLIDPSLRIDRTFGFSSGAVQFLLKSGFNLDTPFKEGVPYLSKTEEEQILEDARQHHNSRSQTAKRAQIVLSEGDVESAAFLAEVRRDIQEWLDVGWEKHDSMNVPSWNATSTNGRSAVTSLNRFQKRLVHQLIESEFPTLTSIGCSDFIRIVKYDKEREDKIFEEKMNRVERRVIDNRGFRWIIEALAGEDLTQMTTEMFEPSAGIVDEEEPAVVRKRIIDQLKLKNGRIPVVGHNLFMDIIYLSQCFYGGLPDRVEDFARFLHKKFPMLIDTKYIFTHDCGDMNPVASLDDISMACEKITKPKIRIDMKHERYQNKAYPHEAGYDSLLTAQNFIKLAVQLPGARSKASRQPSKATRMQHTGSLAAQHTGGINPDVSKTTSTSNKGHSTTKSHSKFASKNVYDTLWPVVSETMGLETGMGNLAVADAGAELIPSFSSPVWKVYGNNLRVFGTHEKVFKLVA